MLPQKATRWLRARIGRQNPRAYGAILHGVSLHLQPRLYPFSRATITAQGSITTRVQLANTGEGTTADGGDYSVLVSYTTATFGATGGPKADHNILKVATSDGSEIVLGYYV